MSQSLKYTADGLHEYQPGSRGRVLRNLLGITNRRVMDKEELRGYIEAERTVQASFRLDQQIAMADVHRIHRIFLGRLYVWAGQIRDVDIAKGGFTFATAFALPAALRGFEREILLKNTPCNGGHLEEICEKIGVVHTEFLLLHPYREGNGRTARLLASVMAYQAGLPGINLEFIRSRGTEFEAYVGAVQAGLARDYAPMTAIMFRGLRLRLARHG